MTGDTGSQGEPDWWDDVEEAERGDLIVNNDTERHYFQLERESWDGPKGVWFEINDPPWNKKKEVLSGAIDADESGGGELHLDQYYREMLEYMIEDSNVNLGNKINSFLRGLNDESGEKLESLVPRPSARGITEAEEGKSDAQSGETTDATDGAEE